MDHLLGIVSTMNLASFGQGVSRVAIYPLANFLTDLLGILLDSPQIAQQLNRGESFIDAEDNI
jgi:hypothetical protein